MFQKTRFSHVSLFLFLLVSCGMEPDKNTASRNTTAGSGNGQSADDTSDPKTDDSKTSQDDTTPPADPKTDTTKPDQTPAPKSVRASGGSGGQTGLVEVAFKSSNNLSSTYKINAPTDAGPNKVYGLHIHLHGDGGGGYKDFPNRESRFDLIGVTVKAPNSGMTWGRQSGVPHGQFLNELIQNELIKKYNIDLDRIYFSGVSGGSYFLTGNFLPTYGQLYNSGAIMLCGGEVPRVAFAKPDMLKTFRLHWQVTAGERTDILPSVEASKDSYMKSLKDLLQTSPDGSVDVTKIQTFEKEGAGGHCEFDGLDYTKGIQSMLDRRFEIILKK